ncbi:MAG: hypothetical protein LBD02_01950 [Christensenellaceae bacterium]|jgi:hypothetical protein|nr:hypothetical protein [Christensenellaceae bacterium]
MADSFRVETVPTPRLDLYGAFARDLAYFMAHEQSPPPQARSALAAEQEKINKFLLYVNESFIIKGFSKYNPSAAEPADSDMLASFNSLSLNIGASPTIFAQFSLSAAAPAHLFLLFSLQGVWTPPADGSGVLTIGLKLGNEQAASWKHSLQGSFDGAQNSIVLPNRAAGQHSIALTAALSAGQLSVPIDGAYAGGYLKLKAAQD